MTYHIGDVHRLEGKRGPLGAACSPRWFILMTPPQREIGATAWLLRQGVTDVWYPTETAHRPSKGRKIAYERRIAPGYLFALFERLPVWDVIFNVGKGRVSGVVGFGERPYQVPEGVLAQMQQVPHRIEAQRLAEDAKAKAERIANAPRPGGKARLDAGPLAGLIVDIERIDGGIAYFLREGIKGQAMVDAMTRAAE